MPLIDSFGRVHDNLRISVTDRCNIRCFYCMPETDVQFVAAREILDFEEIERFVRVAAGAGHRQAAAHRRRAAGAARSAGADRAGWRAFPGIRRPRADHQRRAAGRTGASRSTMPDCGGINVHLDTLDRERFCADHAARRSATGPGRASKRACELGLSTIKLNAVAVKNLVEPDIVPLARFARENGFEIRYIEFMPLDAQGLWDRGKVLLADDMIEMLSREIAPLEPVPDPDPRAPATEYRFADGVGTRRLHRLGEPAVLPELQSHPADRRRQAALLPVRDRRDRREAAAARRRPDDEIAARFRDNIAGKWLGHEINQTPVRPSAPPDVLHRADRPHSPELSYYYLEHAGVSFESI